MTGKMDWRKAGLASKEKISTRTEADRMKWERASRWLSRVEANKKLRRKKYFEARKS